MNFFRRIFRSFKSGPDEQIIGYSPPELEKLFPHPLQTVDFPNYPRTFPLKNIGINAFYSSFLISIDDIDNFEAVVTSDSNLESKRYFNDLPVLHYTDATTSAKAIYSISTREFHSATIRMITDSAELLLRLKDEKFFLPPPWIAFPDYEPSWWGGNMEGAQGYYDENYFYPFFTNLNDSEKHAYYQKFSASQNWINRLELMYVDD
ncbi:hypothetical protein [Pseudomonas sp. SWRI99]|uniref:hypothetical protein n=1 Tax=Pseudomonas sp. SWRI99 TaxID=2745506 RepID=UPI0016495C77|nr:hypothetical protein [Pseudomonas sp. SWRI99]MBC3777177.1 hypothetical protein [Pseudomonas sp. SWRI99]